MRRSHPFFCGPGLSTHPLRHERALARSPGVFGALLEGLAASETGARYHRHHAAMTLKGPLNAKEDEEDLEMKVRVLQTGLMAFKVDYDEEDGTRHRGMEGGGVHVTDFESFAKHEPRSTVRRLLVDDEQTRSDIGTRILRVARKSIGKKYTLGGDTFGHFGKDMARLSSARRRPSKRTR